MTGHYAPPDPHHGVADRVAAWLLPWLYPGEPSPPCLAEPEPEAEP